MSATIELRRRVQSTAFEFAGTVARRATREEMLILLTCIVEHGGQVTAAELGEHLFGRGRVAMADRLLHAAAELRLVELVDTNWTLADTGVEAVAAGHVMTPEFGVWRIDVAEDALLDWDVLSITRVRDPNLFDGTQSARSQARSSARATPPQLAALIGSTLHPASDPTDSLTIQSVDAVDASRSHLSAHEIAWDPIGGIAWLRPPGDDVAVQVPAPTESPDAVLSQVLANSTWDDTTGTVHIPCDKLNDEELLTGVISITAGPIALPHFGDFEHVELSGLVARPVDTQDARLWVRRRVALMVDDYATSSHWDDVVRRASEGIDEDQASPTRDDVAADLVSAGRRHEATYWWLQAPADWDV